tara:strand:+ start:1767 stop:2927 length:1161 start_codon:yes stop_codon:yes gene_type:complete
MNKILLFSTICLLNIAYSECYELSQSECVYWSQYCEWNDETNQCQEFGGGGGGGGGGDAADGPYQYSSITESQGLRNGPDYLDGVLYYPIDAEAPYKSIVFTPGFGGGSAEMSSWAEFFASHGFITMRIGPNDPINDSHQQRGEGLIDAIESIRQENSRAGSPLFGLVDMDSFSVGGYSMGGGASHNAAMIDGSLKAIISLNPTVIFEDCDLCPANSYEGEIYCICLVPEFVEHSVPSLIFAGEVEVNELTAYEGMLGQDVYDNMPGSTPKIMFEGAGSGHGFAAYPYGEVSQYALNWLKYQVLNDDSICESLLQYPSLASQYLTNIECTASVVGDVNNDTVVNVQDVVLVVNLVLSSGYSASADINSDGIVNVLDIVQVVNIILE